MQINPYVVARTIRAVLSILLAAIVTMLFIGFVPLVMSGNPLAVTVSFSIVALLVVGIAIASIFCAKYKAYKPQSNKKAERVYSIIGISLILIVAAIIVLGAIFSSTR